MMTGALTDLATDTLVVVGALFPIVNPIGNTPIFLSLTRGLPEHGRSALARLVALNSLMLLLASIFIGTHILAFFGISLPVVQVGGGLIVTSTGWALLRRPNDDSGKQDAQPKSNNLALPSQSFYPLTLPLTVGPGTISVAIAVGLWDSRLRVVLAFYRGDDIRRGSGRRIYLPQLSLRRTD
jgi:multiple antibiotic resistance protein